jgi:superfamily II DNA or RNA helicase
MAFKPFDYQQNVIDFISNPINNHVVIIHHTGSGKTFTASKSIKALQDDYEGTLFFAPVSVHPHIKKTLKGCGVDTSCVEVLSYAALLKPINGTGKIIVIDEVHNLRTKNGKMAKNAIAMCSQAEKIILMTATPFVNKDKDLNNIVEMCCPWVMGKEIKEKLKHLNISYVEKPPLSEDFPAVTIKDKIITMTKEETDVYRKFLVAQTADIDLRLHDRVGKMGQMFMIHTNGMRRVGDSGTAHMAAKLRYLESSMKEYGQQVIFSSWKDAGVKRVEEVLTSLGITFGTITGEISKTMREKYIDAYNNREIQVLIFSKAGGEGINLIGTRRFVVLEPGWNIVIEEQAMSRCIRFKSHAHLLKDERNILVEKLYICATNEYSSSVDLLLASKYIERKAILSEELMSYLQTLSIECHAKC